ncbi:MAG: SGNH/GDSL hydrolase family protein [Lachnospiraceae bacterium]|nr:SGNH/GDSL hydrolase family protein [Lachnospiraceae bacterium]
MENRNPEFRNPVTKFGKWLIGIGGLLVLASAIFLIKANYREEPVHPQENETPSQWQETEDKPVSPKAEIEEEKDEDPYHGEIKPVAGYEAKELPRIVCWGDSLTEAGNGNAYPDVLSTLTDAPIVNCGLHSDSTRALAIREGALAIYASEMTIPAGKSPVRVKITLENGKGANILLNGDIGINPCRIGAVDGKLSRDGDTYTFTRLESGEAVDVAEGTRIFTQGALQKDEDDVVILFIGANDALSDENLQEFLDTQHEILEDLGTQKYIVIGVTYAGSGHDLDTVNAAMANVYGEHFLDIRDYFLRYGLEDAGITPTAEDKEDLKSGIIPSSLRMDRVHGTSEYYALLAHQVYRKLQILGYLPVDEKPYKKAERIVFWGDSLTEGTKGEGVTFPDTVAELAQADGKKVEIRKYGVFGEMSSLIAARAGGNPMRLRDDVTIPAGCDPVETVFISDLHGYEYLLLFGGDTRWSARADFVGDNSVNPVLLGGIEGNLKADPETGTVTFTRTEEGEPVSLKAGTQVFFHAMQDKRSDDILVIWAGTNDELHKGNWDKTIRMIKTIIDYTGTDRYVVIGMTHKDFMPQIEEINADFEKAFGEHFLDLYSYLITDALDDAGIEPTQEDREFLKDGYVPMSLRGDMESHFNPTGYRLIGKQVYQKLCELGYL